VLNASRHHRKNRPFGIETRSRPAVCSTPRGITGKIAPRAFAVTNQTAVLNASRHHRKNRERRGRVPLPWALEVLNASRHHRKNRKFETDYCGQVIRVLNASRHHRKNRRV